MRPEPAATAVAAGYGVPVPLFWRVFATNALIFAVAAGALALSPATVSFPVTATEALILAIGMLAMLAINLVLLRRVFAPLQRLKRFMRRVDPLAPGQRVPVEGADPEVAELTDAFNEMIERLETERRESARRALAAQEAERARIARDLHDEVGQALTGVMLELKQIGDLPPEKMQGAVVRAREEVRESLEELRQIGRRLRPEALDHLGLRSALTALTTELGRQAGIRLERRIPQQLPALSSEEEVVLYRIAQEALTNVLRHAQASNAVLDLAHDDGLLTLAVTDDGRGFESRNGTATAGVRGMKERAVMIGARLEIESRRGAGTSVRVTLPTGERAP
jgi:two-component system, NarL family, sensor histidine kinase UhpB